MMRCFYSRKMIKNSNTIRAIIFDWGGVFGKSGNPLLYTSFKNNPAFNNEFVNHKTKDLSHGYYTGTLSSDDYWRKYIDILGLENIQPHQARDFYLNYTLDTKMFKLLKKISKKYTTALLSNLNVDMKNKIIKDLQLGQYFKYMIFSNDFGVLKPDPTIYKVAIKKLKLHPNSIMFIDDSQDNIESAKKIGLRTILFSSAEQCILELKRARII